MSAAVSAFVPHAFFNMMGVKSLYEIQLDSSVLKRASLLCITLRNFVSLSERMAAYQNFQFINSWMGDIAPIIRRYGGMVIRSTL
jgi:class 3 adenylate cyclase